MKIQSIKPALKITKILLEMVGSSHFMALQVLAAATAVAAWTNMTPVDPELCASDRASYYRQPLLGPPDVCPVPVGRGGLRQHRFIERGTPGDKLIADLSMDPSDPQNWYPWTHRPVCGTETNYCVFSLGSLTVCGLGNGALGNNTVSDNSDSAAYQGISIITTPEMAAHSLHPHLFALHPAALRAFNDFAAMPPAFAIQKIGGDDEDDEEDDEEDDDDKPALTTSKGMGAVAIRDIRAGEAVVVDRPALLAHFRRVSDEEAAAFGTHEDDHGLGRETTKDRHRLWQAAVDQLSPAVADRIRNDMHVLPKFASMNLTKEDAAEFSHEEKVFASNSFLLGIDGFGFKALFPAVTKFNHDCMPNLAVHISEIPMVMSVWAKRDIKKGEELTLNLLPDLLPSEKRRAAIEKRWGFKCQCSLCTGDDDEAREDSDARRERLPRLPYEIKEAVDEKRVDDALELALEVRGIYAREGHLQEGTTAGYDGQPVADPFGPENLAGTLGTLYLANGDAESALPQLRAALLEKKWRSAGWPTQADRLRMAELEVMIWRLEQKNREDAE